MEFNKKNMRSIMFLITFAILMYLGISNIGQLPKYLGTSMKLITPVIIGAVIAFILNGPMSALERLLFSRPWTKANHLRLKLGRTLSILLTVLLALGIIFGLIFLVVPEIIRTASSFALQIPKMLKNLQIWLQDIGQQFPQIQDYINPSTLDFTSISQKALQWAQNIGSSLLSQTVTFSLSLVSFLSNLIFGIFLAIYILAQKEKLGCQSRALLYAYLPEKFVDHFLDIARLTSDMFSKFITGQMLESFILSMMFLVSLSLFGFPYATLIAMLIMVLSLIPILGTIMAAVIGCLLILTTSPIKALWFIILFLILQQIEGNLIYPRVVGSQVGLPSMWVLIAITTGGAIGGVAGIALSIPLMSVVYVLLSRTIKKRLEKRRIPYYKTDQ